MSAVTLWTPDSSKNIVLLHLEYSEVAKLLSWLFRSWYISAVLGQRHRDVVILIDDSKGMKEEFVGSLSLQRIASIAAMAVLDTLGPLDRVRVPTR